MKDVLHDQVISVHRFSSKGEDDSPQKGKKGTKKARLDLAQQTVPEGRMHFFGRKTCIFIRPGLW
jgi:hypothetical protein